MQSFPTREKAHKISEISTLDRLENKSDSLE